MPAGATRLSKVTIAIPAGVSQGERYAVLWAQLAAAIPPGGGVAAVNRVGIRIYLAVGHGQAPNSDFAITTLEAHRDAHGVPSVEATVHNTGARALDLSGTLNLAGGPGGLSAGPFAAQLGTTLGIGQTERVRFILDQVVPAGPWDARVVLVSGLTSRQATAKITFPVAVSTSSGPVATHARASGGSPIVPVIVGLSVLLGILLVLLLLRRRRKNQMAANREPQPELVPSGHSR